MDVKKRLTVVGFQEWRPAASPSAQPPVPVPSSTRLSMLLLDECEGLSYVFDPESGDLHVVGSELAEVVAAAINGEDMHDDLATAAVEALGLPPFSASDDKPAVFAMTLHLNHACNLSCEYCYADGRTSDLENDAKGAYGGPVAHMRDEVLARALDVFMRDAPCRNVVVGFCGGEPLLSERRFLEAVNLAEKSAHQHGRSARYELTTNATRLTPAIVDVLRDRSFSVAVSVDGGRETHDRQRPLASGGGSYDTVVEALSILQKEGIRFGVRMTAFRRRERLEDDHLALASTPAPVANFKFHLYGDDANSPMTKDEEIRLFAHYVDVASRILAGEEPAAKLTAVRDVLRGIVRRAKRSFQCGAGRWDRAITPQGDVYPCHRFVGMLSFRLGNVADPNFRFTSYAPFEENGIGARWVRTDGSRNCAACYAHHLCGGGCAQIGAANTGHIGELPRFYCEETRLRVRAAVRALYVRSAAENRTTLGETR